MILRKNEFFVFALFAKVFIKRSPVLNYKLLHYLILPECLKIYEFLSWQLVPTIQIDF